MFAGLEGLSGKITKYPLDISQLVMKIKELRKIVGVRKSQGKREFMAL